MRKSHFFQITFFSRCLREHIHLPTHTPSFRPIMPKKGAEHLFLKNSFFFCSLLLLVTPETLPNQVVYRVGVLDHLAPKTYLAYIHSNPNCPCTQNTPGLHTELPQFFMYAKHAWPTYIFVAIVYVRETRPAYTRAITNSLGTPIVSINPKLSSLTL